MIVVIIGGARCLLEYIVVNEMKHGIDCSCDECEKIRQLVKGKVLSGEVYLSGLPEDKKKIMK